MNRFAVLCFALVFGLAAEARAQSLSFQPKNSDQPVEVNGENGIELLQDEKRVIAHGPNATATQGDTSVTADTLIADYRQKADGSNEVYRVYANGNVIMKSPNQTATGEAAVYDFDKAALVLEGDTVTMVSGNGTVTAHKVMQYWSNEHVAVAEGKAYAVDKNDHKLWGDRLVAFFRDDGTSGPAVPGRPRPIPPPASPAKPPAAPGAKADGDSKSDIIYVQAFGNVHMDTGKELIFGDRGAYNLDNGMATVDGSVKMTQQNNQLNGGFAVINVNGGVSHLYASAAQAGMQGVKEETRVRALVGPKTKPDASGPDKAGDKAADKPGAKTPAAGTKTNKSNSNGHESADSVSPSPHGP